MSQIKKTTDYAIFKKHPSNRIICEANIRKIKHSMSIRNLMEFRPILVNESMEVIDGQHRLEAAKQLGEVVWYQVHEESNSGDIILINANQKKWIREDYLNYYISKGNQDYLKVHEYCVEKNITLQEFLAMCPTYGRTRSGAQDKFSCGLFKFPNAEQMATVEKTTEDIHKVREKLKLLFVRQPPFISSVLFRKALICFVERPEVNADTFCIKVTYKIESFHPCSDIASYLLMFKNIYNWRNNNPIN